MQSAASVHDKILGKNPPGLKALFEESFFALHKCSELIEVLCFRIKGLLADILGLKCRLDFAFCFAFNKVWYEWEDLWAGKYIHKTTGNCLFLFKLDPAKFSVRAKKWTWYEEKEKHKTTTWLPQISGWQNQVRSSLSKWILGMFCV